MLIIAAIAPACNAYADSRGKGAKVSLALSVIMPVYNCEAYLANAVRSVLAGGVEDMEIVAVEDCSTDGSRELLCRLAESEPRIKVILNKENLGVAAVRNIALAEASGEYVAFCDSDDEIPKGAYAALLSAAQGRELAIGGFENRSDSGKGEECPLHGGADNDLFSALFAVPCLWTKIIKKELISQHGLAFDEDMRIGEDVVFLSRVATVARSFSTLQAPVYYHMFHDLDGDPSLTHIYTLSAFSQHLECRRRMLSICEAGGISECRRHVYERFTRDLDRMLPLISNKEERSEALGEYRSFLSEYCWDGKEELFLALHGMSRERFYSSDGDSYLIALLEAEPRERVLAEFNTGAIGLRWIIKYFKGWLKYKLKK